MTGLVLRGAILLWAALFLFLGLRGIVDPGVYADNFTIRIDAAAENTLRADFSAFFLVAAGSALLGALIPSWNKALLVPAALFGTALVGRLIGVSMGDFVNNSIVQAMIIEGLSVMLLGGGWWILSHPVKKPVTVSNTHINQGAGELVEEYPPVEPRF
jgi:hypothetical protein